MIPGFAAPWMLPWLAAAALPPLLAWFALRHPRVVRFGPIDLVIAAARRERLTRGGVAWPRTLLRCLLLAAAATAAARPFLRAPGGPSPDAGTTRVVAGAADRRIAIVDAQPRHGAPGEGASLALERAIEALAVAAPPADGGPGAGSPPTVDRVPLGAVVAADDRRLPGRQLVILADGAVPGPADGARIAAAVEAGAAVLVCLGPMSLDESVRPRLAAWLGSLGVGVEGVARLDDAAIELSADLAPPLGLSPASEDGGDGFARLPGPVVTAAAALCPGDGAVLARTVPGGMPLVRVAGRGRGLVGVSAIPLALAPRRVEDGERDAADDDWPRDAAWSDVAAWPVFVPLVDRIVDRLCPDWRSGRAGSARPPAPVAGPRGFRVPLAPAFVAVALLLAIADRLAADASADGSPRAAPWLRRAGRATLVTILLAMLLAWSGGLPATAPQSPAAGPVAFVIDVSPSMDGPVARAAGRATTRLDAVREAVAAGEGSGGAVERIARERGLAVFTAAARLSTLAVGDPVAARLRHIAAVPPAPEASRLGDAVTGVLDHAAAAGDRAAAGTDRGPAAVVVFSDGVITAGASWGQAARAAGARRVPLVAVPVGRAEPDGRVGLPAGFRYTAVTAPRLCRTDAPIEVAIEAEAAGGRAGVPVRAWAEWPATGPPLAAATLDWQPTGPTEPPRLAGRLVVPPRALAGSGSRYRSLVIVAGDDHDDADDGADGGAEKHGGDGERIATTIPLALTDAPLRVLLVESSPRFEWRFLERLLAADPAFAPQTSFIGAQAPAGLRHTASLPHSRPDWNGYDAVVLGDVPFAGIGDDSGSPGATGAARDDGRDDDIAAALVGLRDVASIDGVGVAWLPGRRWQEHPTSGPDWLPARPGSGADLATSTPRRLRASRGGRIATWLPRADGGGPIEPEVFAVRGPLVLGPTARVVATAPEARAAASAAAGPTAIVVDRLGAAQVLGIFCETWRWRQADGGAWSDFWRRGLARLGEPHLLARLFPATMEIQPPAVAAGDVVRITLSPTRATTDLRGWSLAVTSPRNAAESAAAATTVHDIGPAEATGPGGAAIIELAGLPAGVHEVRLVAPAHPMRADGGDVAHEPAAVSVACTLLVAPATVEGARAQTATAALEAAARASGGAVVPLDRLDTLPQVLATLLDRPGSPGTAGPGSSDAIDPPNAPSAREAGGPAIPAAGLRDPMLLIALVAAATAAWWPATRPRPSPEADHARD